MTVDLATARRAAAETKIALRNARLELAEAETAFSAGVDYAALGPNREARDLALATLQQGDDALSALRKIVATLEDGADRAQVELECALDERRALEAQTWAKLADYLDGRVDHINHAPTQAARASLQDTAKTELGEVIDSYVAQYKAPF